MASQAPLQLYFTEGNLCLWRMLEPASSKLAGRDLVSKILYSSSLICQCFLRHPYIVFPAYNEFPRNVFITHNHLDHAGELPLLFVFESRRRYLAGEPRLRVLSGPEVQQKLKTHRLDEMLSLYTPVSHRSLLHSVAYDAHKGNFVTFFFGGKKIIGELLPWNMSKWFCVRCFMLESFISVNIARACLLQNQSRTKNIKYRPQWYLSK